MKWGLHRYANWLDSMILEDSGAVPQPGITVQSIFQFRLFLYERSSQPKYLPHQKEYIHICISEFKLVNLITNL